MLGPIGQSASMWAQMQRLPVWYEAEAGSTNQVAKDDITTEPFKLYVCDKQTAGRGRGGNTWSSGNRAGQLFSSWSFQLKYSPQPIHSCLMGLAVYQAALGTWSKLPWSLKAPNDLYLGDGKVAGLLIENIQQGSQNRMIIGFGMNISESPAEISTATSVKAGLKREINAEEWSYFLTLLFENLRTPLKHPIEQLNPTVRREILQALNRFPHLTTPYLEIDALGNLTTAEGKISWFSL